MMTKPPAPMPCDPHDKVVCDGFLWSFLQGELDPAEALFVAAHCDLSCEARKKLKALTSCAGAVLETIEPQAMRCTAQDFFVQRCTGGGNQQPEYKCHCDVPKSLQPLIGTSFEQIRWKTLLPGIEQSRLKVQGSSQEVRLIRLKKDAKVPLHSHEGTELTLVLKGVFADDGQTYQRGDVSIHKNDAERSHAPQALEDCICLSVIDGPIRLQELLGKILRPFQSLRS